MFNLSLKVTLLTLAFLLWRSTIQSLQYYWTVVQIEPDNATNERKVVLVMIIHHYFKPMLESVLQGQWSYIRIYSLTFIQLTTSRLLHSWTVVPASRILSSISGVKERRLAEVKVHKLNT